MTAGLVAAGAVVAGFVIHTIVSGRELRADKDTLLAKQRAVAMTLGAEWFPLRDRLEADVRLASVGDFAGDHIDAQARTGEFRSQPGLYLRMRLADAANGKNVASVAANAKRDAFAACLLREPVRGNLDAGAIAEQPWNVGQAYAATRILTDDWVRGVKDADEDMRLRVFFEQYDKAVREEIPVAIDVVKRAQFFMLVLDEDVREAATHADATTMTEEALQLVGHPARIHIFDLRTNREILRLRRSGEALVVPAGEHHVLDAETKAAMQRQANNCALAASVELALSAPSLPPP